MSTTFRRTDIRHGAASNGTRTKWHDCHISKRIGATVIGLLAALLPIVGDAARAADGVVVFKELCCDHFVVETRNGHAVLQHYGGYRPSVGDRVVGDYETYGMKHVQAAGRFTRVWVQDYGVHTKSTAAEKALDRCRN